MSRKLIKHSIATIAIKFNLFSRYWPVIDDALRYAAIDRGVSVKLLISFWKHSRPAEDNFLNSLRDISHAYRGVDIQIVWILVESISNIPFSA